jgi:hypothetical protein
MEQFYRGRGGLSLTPGRPMSVVVTPTDTTAAERTGSR